MTTFAIIFDMDGVIADTGDMHEKAWFAYCEKYNIRITSELFRRKLFGRSNKETFKILLHREIDDEELTALVDEKEALYRKLAKGNLRATPGLKSFLKDAQNKDIPMCVASSAPAINVEFTLKETGTEKFFKHFTSAEEVAKSKPDPEIFLLAAKKLGFQPDKCLVFEDSFAGIEAATRANMQLITVASTHKREELPESHRTIEDFTEISTKEIRQLFL
jgi:beta-phosphoglucomutase family hydrolase